MKYKEHCSISQKDSELITSAHKEQKFSPDDKLTESEFFEIICSLPFPIQKNVFPGMEINEYINVLQNDTHNSFNQFINKASLEYQIKNAEVNIKDVTTKIEELEGQINTWKREIRNCKKHLKALSDCKNTKQDRGRPPSDDNPDTPIIMELVKRWINGVKSELEVSSNSGLEKLIFGSARGNWEKWSKGERIPTADLAYQYLSMTIKSGKHKGKKLINIPIENAPTSFDIFNLLCRKLVFVDGMINFDGIIPVHTHEYSHEESDINQDKQLLELFSKHIME